MKSSLYLIVALLAPMLGASAPDQDPVSSELVTEPAASLCVIPLGVIQELVAVLKDGVMGFAEQKEGSEPPSNAQLWVKKKPAGEADLGLCMPSGLMKVSGKMPVEIRVPVPTGGQEAPAWKTYLEIPMIAPGRPQSTFLTKSSPKGDWLATPKQWSFDDSLETFPNGSMRVVNFSIDTVLVIVGEKKLQIPSGRHVIVPTPDAVVLVRVAISKAGQIIPLMNTARKIGRENRMVLATFDWDAPASPSGMMTPVKAILFDMPRPLAATIHASDAHATTSVKQP